MRQPSVIHLAAAERQDFADFLDELSPDQWDGPTLCEEWSVRDVVCHVVSYEELGLPRLAVRLLRGRFHAGGPNALGVDAYVDRTPEQLVAMLRNYAVPRGLTSFFGGRIALTDGLIHHQDIRRPLGLRRAVPGDRLIVALDQALRAPTLPSRKAVANLRLVATDLDWTIGDGPEVRGTGEALLMTIAGRRAALRDLTGPGVETLEQQEFRL